MKDMLEKLPRPVIWMGDLNAHHEDWDNRVTDRRGRLTANIINTLGWTIINNGQPTHLPGTAVDLIIVSADLVPDLDWQVTESTLSSDHFPIIVTTVAEARVGHERLNFKKVNWDNVRSDRKWKEFERIRFEDPQKAHEEIYKVIYEITKKHIPMQKNRRYYSKTWWTHESKEA